MLMRVSGKCYLICYFFPFLLLAGAVCYPTCIVALDVDLRDPVVLPSGTTVDSLKHWMVPTKVQVRGEESSLKVNLFLLCFVSSSSFSI